MAGDADEQSLRAAAKQINTLFDDDLMIAAETETKETVQDDGEDSGDGGAPGDEQSQTQPPVDEQARQEDDDNPDDTADQPSTRKHKLKDGTEVELAELENGYLRQSDYTKKTQALAEERKTIEPEKAKVVEAQRVWADKLKSLEEAIKQYTPQEPNWAEERKRLKPEDFTALVADWNLHERRMAKLAQEREAADAVVAKNNQEAQDRIASERAARLLELLPHWSDQAKAQADQREVLAYAETLGFTAKDLRGITKPELFTVLLDAARYRKLTQGKPPAGKPSGQTTTTLTPGVRRPTAATETSRSSKKIERTFVQAKKSGSVRDAAAAILALGEAE